MVTFLFKIHNLKPRVPGYIRTNSDGTTDLNTKESGFDIKQGQIVLCYLTLQTYLGAQSVSFRLDIGVSCPGCKVRLRIHLDVLSRSWTNAAVLYRHTPTRHQGVVSR